MPFAGRAVGNAVRRVAVRVEGPEDLFLVSEGQQKRFYHCNSGLQLDASMFLKMQDFSSNIAISGLRSGRSPLPAPLEISNLSG